MIPSAARSDPRGPVRCGPVAAPVAASTSLVLRYFEMWNTGQGAMADELLGAAYVEHAHPDLLGPAAARSLVPRVHGLFPSVVVSAEVVLADSELVVVRTEVQPRDADGHPSGPRRGMALFRIADGKLAEQWSWYEPVRAPTHG
ncbi:MAG TPA: nuclear transport factor 2 family protein [Polyangiaceae bacterium]|nr:nuclear transport factor 2 family protein [Polyangiaceae bacterium]